MPDFNAWEPGRFAYLRDKPFIKDVWDYLSLESRMHSMRAAADAGKPAIEPLLSDIESRFGVHLASSEYPDEEIAVLVNNMIKQILEKSGYMLVACGMCRTGRYIKSSGLFSRDEPE